VGERHVAFGRLALLGLILGLVGASASTAAAAPSRAARYPAKGTYAYETVYAGTYDFSYEVTAQSKSQTVHWTSDDSYTWYFDLLDVFHDDGDNRYSEVRSVGEDASGQADTKRDLTSGNNSDDVDGNCQITSTNKPYRQRRNGTFADSEDNPKVTTYWAVPAYADATAIYSRGWNGYHAAPGVSANCVRTADGQPTRSTIPDGHTLLHSPLATTDWGYDDYAAIAWRDKSVPSCGGDYLTPDAEFFRLWDGKGVAGLRDLPYEKSFHFTKSIGGRMDPGQAPITGATSATCSAHVSYATNVKMTSLTVSHRGSLIPTPNDGGPAPDIDHDTPAAEPSIEGGAPSDKVGNLLLADGLAILNGNAVLTRHGLGSGLKATAHVLFPGMPETGVATLDVSGQVISPHRREEQRSADASADSSVLISGSARIPARTLTRFGVALTRAGRSVFTTHRSRPVRVHERLVLNPDEPGAHDIVVTRTVTIRPP
jgi:hypothetical protein